MAILLSASISGVWLEEYVVFYPLLRDHELTPATENEDEGMYSCRELAEMLKRVDDPLVGALIDLTNSTVRLERPLETVEALALTPCAFT